MDTPKSIDELAKITQYKPQSMLSGHTHGGQLSLFGFVPLALSQWLVSRWCDRSVRIT
ncbi:hypothetical protein H6G96_12755 [Nostoc sp. FACHB-892]|uniref:hypothetical protein n=1 Tax=Nostoc sp. FACHB-892 TaxID=2692843 RepID=UPI0016869478|nr:hypothetical protein [Nostoc sp. FACHB-892]MBD2727175.1 hypothetical protein [Nostoc sp. FACHB-892]